MADKNDPTDLLQDAIGKQTEMMQKLFGAFMPGGQMQAPPMMGPMMGSMFGGGMAGLQDMPQDMPQDMQGWAEVSGKLQKMWLDFQNEQKLSSEPPIAVVDPMQWIGAMQGWYSQMPLTEPDTQKQLWEDSLQLWQTVLGRYGIGAEAMEEVEKDLPRKDRRFKDRRWSDQPASH